MAKAKPSRSVEATPALYKPESFATICDYDGDLIGDTITKMKVGQSVNLSLRGKVKSLSRSDSKDRHETRVELEPEDVNLSGAGGNMVSQMKANQEKYDK